MAKNFEVVCPCCAATLVIDHISGEVLLHKAKETRTAGTFEAMVAGLETQKTEAERRFDRNLERQKDRARILEEQFKEALQRADKSEGKFPNPLDD